MIVHTITGYVCKIKGFCAMLNSKCYINYLLIDFTFNNCISKLISPIHINTRRLVAIHKSIPTVLTDIVRLVSLVYLNKIVPVPSGGAVHVSSTIVFSLLLTWVAAVYKELSLIYLNVLLECFVCSTRKTLTPGKTSQSSFN